MKSPRQDEIMVNSAAGGASDYNTKIIEEFRANQGRTELWSKPVAEWPKPVAESPGLGAAQARTARQFPVFMLTRRD